MTSTPYKVVSSVTVSFYSCLQADLEAECPDIMKLGLLHEVGVKKASSRRKPSHPAFLSYGHKSLQEFGASKYVTERLETSENMKVDLNLYLISDSPLVRRKFF